MPIEPPPSSTTITKERLAPSAKKDVDGIAIARGAAKVAIAVAVLLTAWLLATWLAGADRVESVVTATADGGTIGRTLSSLLWASLAMAVIYGVVTARRRSTVVEGSHTVVDGLPMASPGVNRRARAWRSGRWAATAWTGIGAAFVLGTYHGLLGPGAITWGDWRYFVSPEAVRAYFPVPSLWSFSDLGKVNILGASLAPVESAMGLMARAGMPYAVLERMWFFFPAITLSFVGPVRLARRLNADWPTAAAAGAFYSTNPYALVLISGGQLTVGVGYALFPCVALAAMRVWTRRTLGAGVLLGLVVAVQSWYDLRTGGLSLGALVIVGLVLTAASRKMHIRRWPWAALFAAGAIFVLLQGMWVLPAMLGVGTQVPAGYTTASALSSLSLLSLTDGLTLFHPFWPTMHFIALHSVPALWMVVPLLVAIALVRHPADLRTLTGSTLYLVFAALVSGANGAFGPINSWLFTHVPGMDLFRDPSPYLGPVAAGLVVLLAAGTGSRVSSMAQGPVTDAGRDPSRSESEGREFQHHPGPSAVRAWRLFLSCAGFALIVVGAWPAMSGTLRHNLQPVPVPTAYQRIDQAILRSPPGAVLWVPTTSRFAPESLEHPSISAVRLESAAGIGFPQNGQPLAWLGDPSAVRILLDRYHVADVVVRGGAAPYLEQSLAPGPARAVSLASLTEIPSAHVVRFADLTLVHLVPTAGYPTTVYERSAPSGSRSLTPPLPEPRPPTQELAETRFAPGMPGWSAVGDGNNYMHWTLAQSGISATVLGASGGSWLHLTVRYGAAVINQQLTECPSPGVQELRIRYRTTRGTSLSGLIFSRVQQPPVGDVGLPATGGKWVTTSLQFVVAPSLQLASKRQPLAGCDFILSAQPGVAGQLSTADVSAVSLELAPETLGLRAAVISHPAQQWSEVTGVPEARMARAGDSLSIVLPPARHSRLVVFWQGFDPQWQALAGAHAVKHVKANGWANGYIVPPSSAQTRVDIQYRPQRLSVDGGLMVMGGLCAVVLAAIIALTKRGARHRLKRL